MGSALLPPVMRAFGAPLRTTLFSGTIDDRCPLWHLGFGHGRNSASCREVLRNPISVAFSFLGGIEARVLRLSCTLKATLHRGPKALHKPAQGQARHERRPGCCVEKDKALKGRHQLSRPFRALFISCPYPRAASAKDADLPWAGLYRAVGPRCTAASAKAAAPKFAAPAKVNDRLPG